MREPATRATTASVPRSPAASGSPDILARLGMVAEGVYASVSAHELVAKHGVDAPVLENVYRILYKGVSPQDSLRALMRLPAGRDVGEG